MIDSQAPTITVESNPNPVKNEVLTNGAIKFTFRISDDHALDKN